MTDSALALLPSSADKTAWNPQQRALMESLGLKGEKNVQRNGQWTKEQFEAPQAIVEAFIYQINRTGLDPIARQIYCIERGGKWGIQISIDGFRLIAERSGEYRGQTPAQWTDGKLYNVPLREDGRVVRDGEGKPIMVEDFRWLDVWTDSAHPAAARIGIYRDGFSEPMWGVASYDGYVATDRNGEPTGQWKANSANQLAKCAEMLGLRKAFPQELSGLYGTEEMDQASNQRGPAPARARASQPQPIAPVVATRQWAEEIEKAETLEATGALYREAEQLGELSVVVGMAGDKDDGSAHTVMDLFWIRRRELEAADAKTTAPEPLVEQPNPPRSGKRNWQQEARALTSQAEAFALVQEATAAGTPVQAIEELEAIARKLPDSQATATSSWAVAEIPADEPWTPEVQGEPVAEVVPEAGETVIP